MSVTELATPPGWVWHPLGRVMTRSRRDGQPSLDPLSVFLEIGVVPRSDRNDNHNQLGADLGKYLVVQPGDLVFNKLRTWQGGFGASKHTGIVSPAYYVLRPSSLVDSRFIDYLLHSSVYLAELTRLSKWMPPSQFDMPWEDLKALPVPLPPLDVQRRIADFLDDQVAWIGRAVAARQRQTAALDEALMSVGDKALEGLDHAGPPLSAVATIVDTEHKTAPSVPGGGCWIAGTSAIRDGVLVHGNLRETDERGYREWTRRATPQQGDVLLTREAPVGEVALLLPSDPQVAIGQRVVLLRPRQGTSGGFLRAVLMSFVLRRVIQNTTQGSLHPQLNMSDIARLRVPDCGRETQERVASEHAVLLQQVKALRTYLQQSMQLLEERKRSLITAAVSGEFDVSSASSRAAEVALSGVGGGL